MIPWFASASPRTWEKPSASGYFLCICSVSDVQVHSIAAPCRSSSAHSSSHKPTNCHMTAQRNKQICPFEPYGNMWLWMYSQAKCCEQSPSPCRVVNSSRSYLDKVFCSLFMLQVAEAHTEQLNISARACFVWHCRASAASQTPMRLLEHISKDRESCSNTAICALTALCFPKSHRVAAGAGSKQSLWQQQSLSSTVS